MKQIPLTKGKFALVDDEDFAKCSEHPWHTQKNHKTLYARRTVYSTRKNRHVLLLHHFIVGAPSCGYEVDHIDGNGLNNQKANLRFVTHRQNLQNKHHGTSKYPGVSWNVKRQRWFSQAYISGKAVFVGWFTDEDEAFRKYKEKLREHGVKADFITEGGSHEIIGT